MRPSSDALLVAVLLIARVRIDTLAETAVLPLRVQDVARQPFLSTLLTPQAMAAFGTRYGDPISLLLITIAFAALALYLLADGLGARRAFAFKAVLLSVIVAATVVAPAFKLMLLRQGSGPASYSHDGGVIQTEATIEFVLAGKNPYVEDYTQTPMADWGFDEYRSALYHYPYLPWTTLFSLPFYLASRAALGWYDERLVYVLLFVLLLALLPGLTRRRARGGSPALALVAVMGLNPIMGSDVIFGQNDVFVLFWIVLALWFLRKQPAADTPSWPRFLSAVAFGLACASKPTAWFFAPFYALLLLPAAQTGSRRRALGLWLRGLLPAAVVFAAVVLPYFLWNPAAMIDDIWRWANGTAAQSYQIWGWGASNLVLALGLVSSRFAYWPFWIPQVVVSLPALVWLLRQQWHDNRIAGACWRYGLFLFLFLFVSRFMNENYLGYILAFWALGYFVEPGAALPETAA